MASPSRYGYTHGFPPPSASQDREGLRPKAPGTQYSGLEAIPQNTMSHSASSYMPKLSMTQTRYGMSDSQRYGESPSHGANVNQHPPRVYGDHGRSPVFGSMYQPPNQSLPQRHMDGTSGGAGIYPSSTNTPAGAYDFRSSYGFPSSQVGLVPHSSNQAQVPWSQPGHSAQSNFGTMSSDPQQPSPMYQSSVSPVISTGGMSFSRSAAIGQPRTAGQSGDEEHDGRTRNAKAQKRHREKRKAHVKQLEETVLALQNHVRSLTHNQSSDGHRPYFPAAGGGIPDGQELVMSQNHLLIEENQSLRIENEQLKARINELQGLNHPMPTHLPPGTANRFGASGSGDHPVQSMITPIDEDGPSRSLSYNLPSLTIGVKAESGGQSQYSDGTPTGNGPMQNYGPSYGNPGPNRHYASNMDQSPPLLPLIGGSNMLQTPTPAPDHAYNRYGVSPNQNVPGPPSFPPIMSGPSARVNTQGQSAGAIRTGPTSYASRAIGGYSPGYSPGFGPDHSAETLVGGVSTGDGGSKLRERPPDRMSR